MKCRTCKKKLTKEERVKLGYCSEKCKNDKRSTSWLTGITDILYFILEVVGGVI